METIIAKFQALPAYQRVLCVALLGFAAIYLAFRCVDKLGREGAGRTFGWVMVIAFVGLFVYFAIVAATTATRVLPSF